MNSGISAKHGSCVPCELGSCEVSPAFNIKGKFKCDLKQLLEEPLFKRKENLEKRLKNAIEGRRCPDALSTYTLGNMGEDKLDSMSLQTIAKKTIHDLQLIPKVKHTPKIILILESPHKDEYKVKSCSKGSNCSYRDYIRPAPARGSTGVNIKRYLSEIFAYEEFNGYKVALVNPIQYQCSLGNLKLGLKDVIFRGLMSMNRSRYLSCFKERFRSIYNPAHDLVINCCTSGENGRNKSIIWNCLDSLIYGKNDSCPRYPVLSMKHPCCWHLSCGNRCVRIYKSEKHKMIKARCFCQKDYLDLLNILMNKDEDRAS